MVFYKGTTILATVTTAPYTYNWTNVAAGSYSIDGLHHQRACNATLIGPATVALSASATDSDGTVTKVQYFNGATSIGSSTVAPYAINWASVAAGAYSITAKATDDKGGVTTSAPTTIVVNVNVLPTVSIDAPLDNAVSVAPATFGLRASAADSDGTIARVQYFNCTTSIAVATVAPYFVNWSNVAAGSYTVTAKATDNKGGVTTSAPVRLVVNPNVPATVSMTTPITGATYAAPGIIALAAAASDSDGSVTKVQYYNGTVLIGTATTAPYAFSWSGVPIGSYTLTAKATDNKGAVTTSNAVSVTVQANEAPSVSMTAPAANAIFAAPATMTLAASAADSDGRVTKVAFYNGATLIGTDTTAPFTASWANVAIGNYSITAVATDDKGATTTSAAIPVSVKVNALPTVAITAPAANASFGGPVSVTLSAAAADADGTISKVDFYNGAVLIGSATVAPYSVNWADVAVGNYSVTARATDDKGGVSTSAAVAMSVKANLAPVVSITSPADSASLAAPAALTVTANASDADGSVSKVEFYNGATLIGTATMAPYAIALNNVGAGAYVITAKATDNLGLATQSAAVRVTVTGNATQVYFIHTDQIDTPRLITNAAGQAVWQMDLEPFGANLPDENPAGLGTFAYNQRFPGQYFDRETGLHYNYHRDYDPQTGRYIQSDPIGLAGGINTYGYVSGNPLNGTDPFGLKGPEIGPLARVAATRMGITVMAGGGPENPVADIAAIIVGVGSLGYDIYAAIKKEECDCAPIQAAILEQKHVVIGRYFGQMTDRYGQYDDPIRKMSTRKGSWVGHQQQFRDAQTNLRKLIAAAKAKPCPVDPAAEIWANTPQVEVPAGR